MKAIKTMLLGILFVLLGFFVIFLGYIFTSDFLFVGGIILIIIGSFKALGGYANNEKSDK